MKHPRYNISTGECTFVYIYIYGFETLWVKILKLITPVYCLFAWVRGVLKGLPLCSRLLSWQRSYILARLLAPLPAYAPSNLAGW